MNKTNTVLKVFLLFGTTKVNLILLPTDFFSLPIKSNKHDTKLTKHLRLKSTKFRSVQDDTCVLGEAQKCPTPSLRSFPNISFESVLMFVGLVIVLSCPFREDH